MRRPGESERSRARVPGLTRIAHSSVLLDFDGQAILTDPWYLEKLGYYHGEPYGVALVDLPRLAGVMVSHDHYGHYDMTAFAAYPDKNVPFAVKTGMARAARQVGFQTSPSWSPGRPFSSGR